MGNAKIARKCRVWSRNNNELSSWSCVHEHNINGVPCKGYTTWTLTLALTLTLTYYFDIAGQPEYRNSLLQCVSDVHTRQWLRSASSSDLMVPRTIRSTIGERSFQSAAASTWNALSRSVRSSTSVLQFRSRLKTELIVRSYQQSYWICLCVTVTQHFCSVILKSLDLRHVNDFHSNTN